MFSWIIQLKYVLVENIGLLSGIDIVLNSINQPLPFCWIHVQMGREYTSKWCAIYSLRYVLNVNRFISVTKHTYIMYHVSYSWTYLNKLVLRTRCFKYVNS